MMLKHALFLFPLFLFHFSCDMQESSRPSNVEPLEWLDEGVYQIINRHSQLALDVARISREDGANVLQFKPKSSDNQKFRVTPLSNGYYSIRPLHSNKSIEVYEASRSAGGQVRQWYYHGADHQQWDIKASEGGYFTIVSKLSQMALDVWEFSMENDGDIRQWHFTGNANQQWQFKRISQSEEVGEPKEYPLEGEIFGVHDPVMIKTDLGYYVFSTGEGILARHSTDKQSWNFLGHLLKPLPQWVLDRFGDIHIWAPDVAKFAGQYHLYYSVSEFGKNRSCIGLLINDSEDLSRGWKDSGEPVICTSPSDDWNAIDANIAFDEYGTPWMSIGSFWSGLKILRLDGATGMPADHGITSIATRLTSGRAIEAPFIHYNNGYYYLFVSFDYCCKGADSTYRIMVGRSKNIDGPYYDKSGRSMLQGGGSLLLQSGDRWRGPGHNAIFAEGERTYLVFHAYDRDANGLFSLKIADIIWDQDDWPKTISLD